MKNIFTTLLLLLLFSSLTIVKAQPLPITPGDGGVAVPLTTDITWTGFDETGATSANNGTYEVNFYTDGTYTVQLGVSITGIADGGATTTVLNAAIQAAIGGALVNNTEYFWTVEDEDGGTVYQYSFTTEIATAVITAPLAAATGVSVTPTINWTFAGGIAGVTFDLEIDDSPGFGSVNYSALGLSGALTSHVVGSALNYNTGYYVRITAKKSR